MAQHTVDLDARQERALAAAAARHNADAGTALTPGEYFALKAGDFVNAMVRGYEERIKNQMAENFAAMTPEQQAQVLQLLGIEL